MFVVEIIPIGASFGYETLSYLSSQTIEKGKIVSVPLQKREIQGLVIQSKKLKDMKQTLRSQNFTLKKIKKIHPYKIFSPAYLKTIEELSRYFLISEGQLITITYPKYLLKNIDLIKRERIKAKNTQEGGEKILQDSYDKRIDFYQDYCLKNLKKKESIHFILPTRIAGEKLLKAISTSPELRKRSFFFSGENSSKKIEKYFQRGEQNKANIIISTPLFIDLPQKNKKHIILEEDSSPYYKRAVSPRIDLNLFVTHYAKNINATLIYADKILKKKRFQKEIKKIKVEMQIFDPKKIEILNYHKQDKKKKNDQERITEILSGKSFSPFGKKTLSKIKKSVAKKEKIFLYSKRKSLAPYLICQNCGKLVQNLESGTPYSLYEKNENGEKKFYYIDTLEQKIIPAFDHCQFCGSWRIQSLGIGTETIYQKIQELFPEKKIFLIDAEHIKNKTELKKILKEIDNHDENKQEAKIIIGTQKAIPYLKNIENTFVLSIDGFFYQMTQDNEMRALYTITNIYERNLGKIYIQTRQKIQKRTKNEDKILEKKNEREEKKITNSLRFSEQILHLKKTFFARKFGKLMKSNLISDLQIWKTLTTGNYQYFLKGQKESRYIFIKIKHELKKQQLLGEISSYYKENLSSYLIKMSSRKKKDGKIQLELILKIEQEKWNPQQQEQKLLQILPKQTKGLEIELDPEKIF